MYWFLKIIWNNNNNKNFQVILPFILWSVTTDWIVLWLWLLMVPMSTLKIQMEKRLVSGNGHLPCITTRSNFARDILEDNDSIISFNDVLGKPENFEGLCQPHDVIEASLAKNAFNKGYSANPTGFWMKLWKIAVTKRWIN